MSIQRVVVALVVLVGGAVVLGTGSAPARAANLLVNPHFHTSLAGWGTGNQLQVWSSLDVHGDPHSGSARGFIDQAPGPFSGVAFRQCVPVDDATEYEAGAFGYLPPGQDRTGAAIVSVYFYSGESCTSLLDSVPIGSVETPDLWTEVADHTLTPPAGARSATFFLIVMKNEPGGEIAAHFDDARLCPVGDCEDAAPAPPFDTWIGSAGLPGFEAQVRITPAGATPIEGAEEADCIGETICARGALPGRPEIFVKVIGPRPNGFLWVQLIRFTPSKVEVWLRQVGTGQINYYALDATTPGAGVLPGLEDRGAYLP